MTNRLRVERGWPMPLGATMQRGHELVEAFLGATFTAEERHRRRLEKIKALEKHW